MDMVKEKRALRRIVQRAAYERGQTVRAFLSENGLAHSTYYRSTPPTLGTVYATCDAAGVKVSEFFRMVGR